MASSKGAGRCTLVGMTIVVNIVSESMRCQSQANRSLHLERKTSALLRKSPRCTPRIRHFYEKGVGVHAKFFTERKKFDTLQKISSLSRKDRRCSARVPHFTKEIRRLRQNVDSSQRIQRQKPPGAGSVIPCHGVVEFGFGVVLSGAIAGSSAKMTFTYGSASGSG